MVCTVKTLVLYMCFSSTNPIFTAMLTDRKRIIAYKLLQTVKTKKMMTIVCFLLLSYINSDVCFDGDWIFNPMTKHVSPCIVEFALM